MEIKQQVLQETNARIAETEQAMGELSPDSPHYQEFKQAYEFQIRELQNGLRDFQALPSQGVAVQSFRWKNVLMLLFWSSIVGAAVIYFG